MPKIVDHDLRREEIAQTTLGVIRRVGVENATVRAISKAGGYSSGVLAHYFSDKDELIAFAFQWTSEMAYKELAACAIEHPPGIARVRSMLERMLPVPKRGAEHTHLAISTSFWGHALRNPRLARLYHRNYDKWRAYVRRYIREAIDNKEVPAGINVEDEVDLLVSSMDGLWVAESLEPTRFTPARRKRLIDRMIGGLTGRPKK